MALTREQIEQTIGGYVAGCNEADGEKIRSVLAPDAVHYFPGGGAFGAVRGAGAIVDLWLDCVERLGSCWTLDRMMVDPEKQEAVIEWTHYKPRKGEVLRGAEWYHLDDAGLITELRAYYACPTHEGVAVHQIGEFPYAERGYSTEPPAETLARRS